MIGAKMASFEVGDNQHRLEGCSIEQASKLVKVGISSIVRARKVLGYGDPETIQQVEAGKLSVSKAADLAKAKAKQAMKGEDEDGSTDESDNSGDSSADDAVETVAESV